VIDVGGVAFASLWERSVGRRADATFLVFERSDGATASWTYRQFDALVSRCAATLVALGVGKGDSISLALTNSPAFVATWIAAVRLGAWIVPSDPMSRTQELVEHLSRTGARVGVCSVHRRDVYLAASGSMPVIEVDEDDCTLEAFGAVPHADWPAVGPRDRAAVMFTSGTTGRPKGVVVTQANYSFAGQVMATAAELRDEHRQIVVLPLFHANAQYYSFASAIAVGASVALVHGFSASRFLGQAKRHGATHASLFAAPIRMVLARGATPVPGLALQHCWYAMNLADGQYEEFAALVGCRPRQLYGMTETIPAVLTDSKDSPRADCMGYVSPSCEVELQGPGGVRSADGEVGEIAVRGVPGITLFDGYLNDAETTARSFRGEWFLTGDRAVRDHAGRHWFDGRRADVLKVSGENVSIVEVEQVLSAHPGLLEAAVVGRPDPVRDEVPVAYVVARNPASPPTTDELHEWCAQRLSKSKVPRDIVFLDELPRTSVGKIRKFMLKEDDRPRAMEGAS
jgi:crotonobetaine/carnitine-CoA ligase